MERSGRGMLSGIQAVREENCRLVVEFAGEISYNKNTEKNKSKGQRRTL